MATRPPLDPAQCRAARAMVGWSREALAIRSGVAVSTLADFEAGKRSPYARTLWDVRRALESAGVEFIGADGDGKGSGVRAAPAPEVVAGQGAI